MEIFIVPYDKTTDIEVGFTKQKHYDKIWNKYNDIGKYVDENIAKNHSEMQQIIPYIILKNKDNKYFTAILENKDKKIMSIGFGNNIIPIDGVYQPLFKGAVRTLLDDVDMEVLRPMKFVGTVRDMLTNKTQIGYVFLIDNVSNEIKLNNNNLKGSWKSKEELIYDYKNLESWSKHIVNFMVDNIL